MVAGCPKGILFYFMKYYQIENIELRPDEPERFSGIISKKLNISIPEDQIAISHKSLDCRNKSNIIYRYRLIIQSDGNLKINDSSIKEYTPLPEFKGSSNLKGKFYIIVGAGPAGLFAAIRLLSHGARVLIIERGDSVEERTLKIKKLNTAGELDFESNVVFGEGGAGTYSDGKLTSRGKHPEQDWLWKKLIQMGANESIYYEAKPHIGSDILLNILKNIRNEITQMGGEYRFCSKVTDLIISNGNVEGVILQSGEKIKGDGVILATGHSARDTYRLLDKSAVGLKAKGFALGVRMEHERKIIDDIQYGKYPKRNLLPAAEYFIASHNNSNGRGTYTFCMCPGGYIVNSSSEENALCINGMSNADRNNIYSNAALVVSITPSDFGSNPLAGLDLQRSIERKACNLSHKAFAPAQSLKEFLSGKKSNVKLRSSYLPDVYLTDMKEIFPEFVTAELKRGLNDFIKKMPGLNHEKALLLAPETRTSSPVRIERKENFESVSHGRLYPVGEGAGYAGGIVSSAVDGIRAADAIAGFDLINGGMR